MGLWTSEQIAANALHPNYVLNFLRTMFIGLYFQLGVRAVEVSILAINGFILIQFIELRCLALHTLNVIDACLEEIRTHNPVSGVSTTIMPEKKVSVAGN